VSGESPALRAHLVAVFQAAWHDADEKGESGNRTAAGIDAVLAELDTGLARLRQDKADAIEWWRNEYENKVRGLLLTMAERDALQAQLDGLNLRKLERWGVRHGDGEVTEEASHLACLSYIASVREDIDDGWFEADDYEPMTVVTCTRTAGAANSPWVEVG